jgi:hypothetical protein
VTSTLSRGEHDCLAAQTLDFAGHYAAPGHGQAWVCRVCGREWAKVGGAYHDPRDGAHLLAPEDVV